MTEIDWLKPSLPQFIQFETSTACQARCKMCPHDSMKRSGVAKWSQLTKIIHETVPTATNVCPFLMQEPFLEKRLTSILANIKQNNSCCQTTLYSNMGAATPEILKEIVDGDLLDVLAVSFYAPTPELHRKYQDGVDTEKARSNILWLINYRNSQGKKTPLVQMQYLDVPELMAYLPKFVEEWRGKADSIGVVNFDTFHGKIPRLSGNKDLKVAEKRVPCQRLWSGLNIHFDGNVVPCCIDYDDENVMGNINAQSAQEVWQGEKFTAFRKLHLEGKWDTIPMCKNCDVWKYQFSQEWRDLWKNKC